MSSYPVAPAPRQGTLSATLKPFPAGPTVAIPVVLVRFLGDWTAAAFVAQCCYLSDRHADSEGWFFQSHDQWQRSLNLSPDQVRRCVRSSRGIVQTKRKGIPGRNAYRVQWDVLQQELERLYPDITPEEAVGETPEQPAAAPVTSHGQPLQAVARQTPPHSSVVKEKEEKKIQREKDDVWSTPPVSTEMLTRLLNTWNEHRGELPEAGSLGTHRRRALTVLLVDCGGDVEQAAELLADATKEVATDDFWKTKRFGLDTLLPKVLGKAEAHRSRKASQPSQAAPLPNFGIGQLVLYRRERYAIEAITDRYIDLWDDENGSARILLNSDDIRAVRPMAVHA